MKISNKICHCEERSNRKPCTSLYIFRDCFVPRNDMENYYLSLRPVITVQVITHLLMVQFSCYG